MVVNYTILPVSDLILKPRACIKSKRKNLQPKNRVALLNKQVLSGLEIISRLPPVKLSGQTYFCSDTTHFWPDKYPLRRVSINFFPPPPPRDVYISNKYICYAFIVHAASNSMHEKVERTVQPQCLAKSILHLCIQLSLQFHVFNTVKF